MKKYIKVLIILIIVVVLTGCSSSINLDIKEDLSIEETARFVVLKKDIQYLNRFEMVIEEASDKYIENLIDSYKDSLSIAEITREDTESDYIARYNKNYDSLIVWNNNSPLNKLLKTKNYTINGDIITLNLAGTLSDDIYEYLSDSYITITSSYLVTDSNSDQQDNYSNMYKWKVSSPEINIRININQNEKFISEDINNDSPNNNLIILLIIIGFILALVIALYIYRKKQRQKYEL